MIDQLFSGPLARGRSCPGTLASRIDSFARRLQELGYARSTRRVKLWVVADFGRWLHRRKLRAADVDEQIVVKYLRRHRRASRSG